MSKTKLLCLLSLLVFTVTGCSSLSYYQQAIGGHLGVTSKKQPIDRLLTSPDTPERLRTQLDKVASITAFAEQQLSLPANGNYNSYVDLERRYIVWNVFAAPELSLKAKTWCYPFAGCASYRGYYSEEKARQYANKLKAQGWEVYVGGITAYSTLGWFNDPVLNTFIYRSDAQLANLIFHELAHQKLYIKGDTQFNESFATVVAREGVKRWLIANGNRDEYELFLEEERKLQQFVDLVLSYRNRLAELYQSTLTEKQKQAEKALLISELRNAHKKLKAQWGGQSNYEDWFAGNLNNAQLNTVATYFDLVPEFEALITRSNYDLNVFYQACETFSTQPRPVRSKPIKELSPIQGTIDPQPTTL